MAPRPDLLTLGWPSAEIRKPQGRGRMETGPAGIKVPTACSRAPGPALVNRKSRLRCRSSRGFEIREAFLISPAATAFPKTCRTNGHRRGLAEQGGGARLPLGGPRHRDPVLFSKQLFVSSVSAREKERASRLGFSSARARAGGAGRGRGHYISRRRSTQARSQHTLQTALYSQLLSWRC